MPIRSAIKSANPTIATINAAISSLSQDLIVSLGTRPRAERLSSVSDLLDKRREPPPRPHDVETIQDALERAGVEFTCEVGVKLRGGK